MEELLHGIAAGLVHNSENVKIESSQADGVTQLRLKVADDDAGRVIGKHGKIAKAIRTVLRARAAKDGVKVNVEID